MPFADYLPSFNAGEFSPYMRGRYDVAKYKSGCLQLENFIVMPYGGVYRRPGTEYIAAAKARPIIIGFNFSTTTSFVIEMGAGYFRFFSNGLQVINPATPGIPLEVSNPYAQADIYQVQYVQINDLMYFVHPNYPVYKMTRVADNNWTFTELSPDWPAVLDENTESTTITPSGTTGSIALTASSSLFVSAMVGGYFQIGHDRTSSTTEKSITATGTSSSIPIIGTYDFNTYGTWSAEMKIERSYDGGTSWETVRTYKSAADFNAADNFTQEKEALIRVNVTAFTSGSGRAVITASDAKVYGFVRITNVSSDTSATATVIKSLAATSATTFWSEGAWSQYRGYPRSVTLHEQRIFYGGTKYRPLTLWASVVDDFDNMRTGTTEVAGLSFTLSASESNPIQWMVSQESLLIGTAGEEWTLSASDTNTTISPNNVRAFPRSKMGSKYISAKIINNVILFIQRQGRKVRELVYNFGEDNYDAPDLSIFSEHITDGEILQTAIQQQPDTVLWMITGAGRLVGMTYERDQDVIGWHRHSTDGVFESVATIYGSNGPDEIWFVVKRTINGSDVRYIERFKVDFRDAFEDADKLRWWYSDCAKRVTLSPAGTTVTGLTHLEGKTVQVFADGATAPDKTVASGQITLQEAASDVLVGLQYISVLQPMFWEASFNQGSTVGNKKRIPRAFIYRLKSLGGEYSTDNATWTKIFDRAMSDKMDSSPPVETGPYDADVAGSSERLMALTVRQAQPLPLTILAINTHFDVSGA